MKFTDPHIHMYSRTTADYEAMKQSGIVAVIEPSFGLGNQEQPLVHSKITLVASQNGNHFASQFQIKHYTQLV